jgi:inhibitor of cysteine peptidase
MMIFNRRSAVRRYVLFFALILMAGGCSPPRILVVDLSGDRAVTAGRGTELTVRLKANPTTGYSWQVSGAGDNDVLKSADPSRYEPDSDRMGSGGVESFFFTCVGPGKAELVFEYERPWEDKEPDRRYLLTVRVR